MLTCRLLAIPWVLVLLIPLRICLHQLYPQDLCQPCPPLGRVLSSHEQYSFLVSSVCLHSDLRRREQKQG